MGLGISEAFLDNFGFHAFNSGMLCIGIGSDVLGADLLSSGTLSLLIPSINDLLRTPNTVLPVFIQLRPQDAPTITVGAGGATDPLLNILLRNLDIDMYLLVDDRLVRILTANTSFAIGVDITIDPAAGTIIPVINTDQLQDLQVSITNTELLSDDPDSIASILSTII